MILDTISLTDIRLDAIIGILDFEQERRQPLDIEVDMMLSLEPAADSEDVADTVDYALVTAQIELLADAGRWWLLESLAKTLCRTVLIPPAPGEGRADVREIEVRLAKPTILDGRATPSIRMHRHTAWCRIEREHIADGVEADWLGRTRLCDVARVRLRRGSSWTVPADAEALALAGLPAGRHAHGAVLEAAEGPGTALVVWQRPFVRG